MTYRNCQGEPWRWSLYKSSSWWAVSWKILLDHYSGHSSVSKGNISIKRRRNRTPSLVAKKVANWWERSWIFLEVPLYFCYFLSSSSFSLTRWAKSFSVSIWETASSLLSSLKKSCLRIKSGSFRNLYFAQADILASASSSFFALFSSSSVFILVIEGRKVGRPSGIKMQPKFLPVYCLLTTTLTMSSTISSISQSLCLISSLMIV